MSDPKDLPAHLTGGNFLFSETKPELVFTPEDLSSDEREMASTAEKFMDKEVFPHLEALEHREDGVALKAFRSAAQLGLLGLEVPEEYGGLGLGKVAAIGVAEQLSRLAGFGITCGAHSGIGTGPITYFGTEAQKRKYLPRLAPGELMAAYCLSEAGSGSDALGMKTKAVLNAARTHYVLNGAKMWITNAAWADVFVVFAKVDGEHVTAFIVEKAFPGVSSGKEEHKMGLHGSSTTPIILQDAKVPADNVLGEIGRGHKVALNTLNFGRFKLGAMCIGGSRSAIGDAAKYAAQRKQFGHAIASFGAIRHKLGEMTARTYAVESLMYRTAGLIDAALDGSTHTGAEVAAAFEEFAVEASIAKVAGTETLDYVLDENIQIHGGNGYVKEYRAERYYRDARVNRIFEGTNEINRLLIPGMLIRRALKGELPLIAAAKRLQDEILTPSAGSLAPADRVLDEEIRAVAAFKKVALMVLGTAMQTYGPKLTDEQEVLGYAADIIIDIYAAESAVLRAAGAAGAGDALAALHEAAARAFVSDAAQRIDAAARSALAAMSDGDTLRTLLAALRRVLKVAPVNTVALRRELADATVSRAGYIFS